MVSPQEQMSDPGAEEGEFSVPVHTARIIAGPFAVSAAFAPETTTPEATVDSDDTTETVAETAVPPTRVVKPYDLELNEHQRALFEAMAEGAAVSRREMLDIIAQADPQASELSISNDVVTYLRKVRKNRLADCLVTEGEEERRYSFDVAKADTLAHAKFSAARADTTNENQPQVFLPVKLVTAGRQVLFVGDKPVYTSPLVMGVLRLIAEHGVEGIAFHELLPKARRLESQRELNVGGLRQAVDTLASILAEHRVDGYFTKEAVERQDGPAFMLTVHGPLGIEEA